jgi:hypothetical protein
MIALNMLIATFSCLFEKWWSARDPRRRVAGPVGDEANIAEILA